MDNSNVHAIPAEDQEMQAAIAMAKKSIAQFFVNFLNRTERQTSFLLKVAVEFEDCLEHIWIADLDLTQGQPRGIVASEPISSSLRYMQPIVFEPSQITDWMYVDDGILVGGFSIRVIRSRMSSDERSMFDGAVPYRIESLDGA